MTTYRLYEANKMNGTEDVETLLAEIGIRVKDENNEYRSFGDIRNDIVEAFNGNLAYRFCDRIAKAFSGKDRDDFELNYICDIPEEHIDDEKYVIDCTNNRANKDNYCAIVKFIDGKFNRCIKALYANPTMFAYPNSLISQICREYFR